MNKNNESDLFALDSEEIRFIKSKNVKTKLPFAVMIKYFRLQNCFPANEDFISHDLIRIVSNQLNSNPNLLIKFDWESRTAERFRQEIREFLGYRKASIADSEKLIRWLIENVLPHAPTIPQSCEKADQFFRENKLESYTSRELERYVRSASYQFENQFFSNIFSELPTETICLIDDLLGYDDAVIVEDETNGTLDIKLHHIKKDIPGAKLKNVISEINKINHIRRIQLPIDILNSVPRKLLQKYYTRIIAELPSNIKDHNPKIRYSTMSAFCYIRSQLMTDNLVEVLTQLIHKIKTTAESSLTKEILAEVKCVNGKFDIEVLTISPAKVPNSFKPAWLSQILA